MLSPSALHRQTLDVSPVPLKDPGLSPDRSRPRVQDPGCASAHVGNRALFFFAASSALVPHSPFSPAAFPHALLVDMNSQLQNVAISLGVMQGACTPRFHRFLLRLQRLTCAHRTSV